LNSAAREQGRGWGFFVAQQILPTPDRQQATFGVGQLTGEPARIASVRARPVEGRNDIKIGILHGRQPRMADASAAIRLVGLGARLTPEAFGGVAQIATFAA